MPYESVSRRVVLSATLALAAGCIGPAVDPVPIRGSRGAGTVTVDTVKWSKKGRPAPKKGYYLSLKLTWKCTEGRLSVNASRLTFKALLTVYNVAYWGADVEPILDLIDLHPGGKTTGWVSFDVPADRGVLVIEDEGLNEVAQIPIPGP